MMVPLREAELQVPARRIDKALPVAEGTLLDHTYFRFAVTFPRIGARAAVEVPDDRLYQHIVWSGSLDWMAEPGEDVYTIEDGEPL
jgi:hypothetical protein